MAERKRRVGLNWFDLAVIVIVVGIAAAAVYKFYDRPVSTATVPLQITVLVEGVREMTANNVAAGDPVREDTSGLPIGKIAKVEKRMYEKEVETADGRVILTDVDHRYTLEITFQVHGVYDDRGVVFANNDWQIGKRFPFKTNKVRTEGFIVALQKGWD